MKKQGVIKTLLIVISLSFVWAMGEAACFEVTSKKDNVPGSLRSAITMANSNNEDDTIYLPAGTYLLGGTPRDDKNEGGDLDINTSHRITIIGCGSMNTIIDANLIDRVMHILHGEVLIIGVSFQYGKLNCPGTYDNPEELEAEHGGGIYNNGILTLKNCSVSNNISKAGCYSAPGGLSSSGGGHGGGIYNIGIMTLYNCTISNNITGTGITDNVTTTASGDGGGIYNEGTLDLTDCQVSGNTTGNGVSGRQPKSGGFGAGIYNNGTITLTRSIIDKNTTGSGGDGIQIGSGGSGGFGGGLVNHQGYAALAYCTISSNKTGDGGSNYAPGDGGDGGGIYNTGSLNLYNSAIIKNSTGDGCSSVEGSNGGSGGGLCSIAGSVSLTNCTVSSNTTGDGGGGPEDTNGHQGGYGAGIFNSTKLSIRCCTIGFNKTGIGADNNNGGYGGGIYNDDNATVDLSSTIIANNQVSTGGRGPDCLGTMNSEGYNLVKNLNYCNIIGNLTGNITGVDPQLEPLAKNGGFTECHALKSNSPALDAGSDFGIPIDQRGYERPEDINGIANAYDGADIGAYEYNAASFPRISLNQTLLNFYAKAAESMTDAQTINITNSGSGTLLWSVTSDVTWLTFSPHTGNGDGNIRIQPDTRGLSAGSYLGTITIGALGAINSPQTVEVILRVYPVGNGNIPFGSFDTPIDGSTVMGGVPVTGWVLDDIGTESVKIYRNPLTGEGKGLVYIGDAVFVEGARTDIEKAFPDYPNNNSAGWGYMMLSNLLPRQGNGTFTIVAKARDIEGNTVTLGEKTIKCDNANAVKPFGAIDTPAQGGPASGSNYVNFGWALTPLPKTIPKDGSTITVWVDGKAVGHPVYNRYREDVATLFPGYNNSNGAVGYFYLDTTQYKNGVHTIQWTVTDDAGKTDGIGSRYFNIQGNSLNAQQAACNQIGKKQGDSLIPVDYSRPVEIIKGYDQDMESQIIYPDEKGNITIEIRELERIEIHFYHSLAPAGPGGMSISHIPIGGTLEPEQGIFSWLPGPGYLGPHEFIFIIEGQDNELMQTLMTIIIKPKFGEKKSSERIEKIEIK